MHFTRHTAIETREVMLPKYRRNYKMHLTRHTAIDDKKIPW